MNVKKTIAFFVLLNCFVFTIVAQDKTHNICSELKKAKVFFSDSEILVIGEVFRPQAIKLDKFPLTLSRSIATVGGFSKKAFVKEIQVLKCSLDFSSVESKTLVNFQKIKNGSENGFELKGGEIIYVPSKISRLNFMFIDPKQISKENYQRQPRIYAVVNGAN